MDPYQFEELVAEIWELQGYDSTVSRGSRDRGVDIVATRESPFSQKVLIQAKRYTEDNKVGSPEVRKYATLYQQETDVDTVVIVTTGSVTSEAQRVAQEQRVKIMDGDSLAEMVVENQQGISSEFQSSLFSTGELVSDESSSRRASSDKFDTGKVCPNCHGPTIKWVYVGRLGKCRSCQKKFKYKDGKYVSLANQVEQNRNGEGDPRENESEEYRSEKVNKSSDNTEGPVFPDLGATAILLLLLSMVHSLITWSLHSYQLLLLICILALVTLDALKQLERDQ